MMQLRWKSRLFVLLAAGILACGMAGYSVKAAENSGGTDGTVTTTPGETTDKIDISGFEVTLANSEYTYSGSAITPEVTVRGKVKEDAAADDQTGTGDSSDDSSSGSQTADSNTGNDGQDVDTGSGGAGGQEEVSDPGEDTYREVTLQKDTDYTVTYKDNTNAGEATVTVTGTGEEYTGTVTKKFTINKKDIADLQMEDKDKVYRGSPINADVNMYYNNVKLVRGTDYRIKDYVNNENVGTASATVKGKGNYTGQRTMTFEISAKNIYELSYTPDLSKKTYTYTGQALKPQVNFTFTVTGKQNAVLGQKTLVEGVDYTITYADNKKVGVAGVMVIGKGNFSGSRIMSFKIRPQDTKLKKLVKGKKKLKAKWAKKDKQVTGYVVMCSTKKDFSSNVKKVKVKKGTTKYTFKNLKSKKKYYVRVRTYKKVMGITYYSSWSNVMKIKTK